MCKIIKSRWNIGKNCIIVGSYINRKLVCQKCKILTFKYMNCNKNYEVLQIINCIGDMLV